MTETELTLEVWKLIISLLTPLFVIVVGLIVSRKLEKNKLDVLKEKEWQVKWAELFLKQATDFNDNITSVIFSLFSLQDDQEQSKIDEAIKRISTSNNHISEIDWNIRNYAQFSETYGNEVIQTQ